MTAITEVFERKEKKYLMSASQYRHFAENVAGRITADEFGLTTICSLYYDTPSFNLINRSIEKPLYKEKLRVRSYGVPCSSDPVFVEIKRKFKGVVYKRRVCVSASASTAWLAGMPYEDAVSRFPLSDGNRQLACMSRLSLQIAHEIDFMLERYVDLRPAMVVSSERVACFAPDEEGLRVTFDQDVRWRTERLSLAAGTDGEHLLDPGQQLMEIKCLGAYPRWLLDLLDHAEVYPSSFSKYGTAYASWMYDRMHDTDRDVRIDDGHLYPLPTYARLQGVHCA